MNFIDSAKNFTPHPVIIFDSEEKPIKSFPSVGLCRAIAKSPSLACEWIPGRGIQQAPNWGARTEDMVRVGRPPEYTTVTFEGQEPGETDSVIVSFLAAEVLARTRPDLIVLSPDTGPGSVVRDQAGAIVGCRRLTLWTDLEERIIVCEPFNPANPYDGHEIKGIFPRSLEGAEDAIARARLVCQNPFLQYGWLPPFVVTEEADAECIYRSFEHS